jgi:uncharacterized membrane protein
LLTETTRQLLKTFLTGFLAALPLIATLAVVIWILRLLYAWFGPGSFIGRILVRIGFGGVGTELVAYLIGMLIVMLMIFALGILVQTRLRGVVSRIFNRAMKRIPVIGKVYDMARRFVALLAQRDNSQVRSMSPVWLHFGGPGGAAVLGLLSSPEPVLVNGEACLAVLVPTAPVPVGGGLLYVPQHWVTPARLGVEAVTSIYVSMGITSSQHLETVKPGAPEARLEPAQPAVTSRGPDMAAVPGTTLR